jgi:formate dehydrogenase maturation protein FdhE
MAKDYHEKEFDDEVYEDGYYEDEEELEDDDYETEHLHDDEDDIEEEMKVHVSFACEDCDYRWDDIIVKVKGSLEEEEFEHEGICPMCGSMNITQI